MHSPTRFLALALALAMTSCSTGPFDVASTVIEHETTQEISVWSPEAEGSWPIVYALHGLGGSSDDLAILAEALARRGVVVFAADYRTTQPQYVEQDAECGYRYALSVAEDYGGDLDQPITFVGHSFGASGVLVGGLVEGTYGPGGTYEDCFTGRLMPDVIVAISGCHYEFEGESFPFDISGFSNKDADIVLVAGTEDEVCASWQSRDAAEVLRSAGYTVDLVEIEGANHFTVIFHDVVGDEWLALPDNADGNEVVQAVLDAIQAAVE